MNKEIELINNIIFQAVQGGARNYMSDDKGIKDAMKKYLEYKCIDLRNYEIKCIEVLDGGWWWPNIPQFVEND